MSTTQTTTHQAGSIGEYGPFGEGAVHGVTFDNELVAFDPDSEKVVERLAVPAQAGTAFDGEHLSQIAQIAKSEILVSSRRTGASCARCPRPARAATAGWPGPTDTSGSASTALANIHQLDAKTGEIIKTRAKHISGIESNGKGVFWCGGEGGKLRLVQKTAKS